MRLFQLFLSFEMFNCLLSLGPAWLGYKRWGCMTSGGFSMLLTLFPRCWFRELQILNQKRCKEHRIQILFCLHFTISLALKSFWKHIEKRQVEALMKSSEAGEDMCTHRLTQGAGISFTEISLSQVFWINWYYKYFLLKQIIICIGTLYNRSETHVFCLMDLKGNYVYWFLFAVHAYMFRCLHWFCSTKNV